MKGSLRNLAVLAVALLLWTGSSFAKGNNNYDGPCGYDTGHACPANSPEIDPTLGTGVLVLVGGWALVLRDRRNKA